MEALELAGQLVMEYGGETYRAEETVSRMGQAFGLENVQTFAVPSGLFLSYHEPAGEYRSSVRRVHSRGADLSVVDEVNAVSRRVEGEGLEAAAALWELQRIRGGAGREPLWVRVGAAGLCGCGFTLMFGGGAAEAVASFVTAALVQALTVALQRVRADSMISVLFRGFLTALLPLICLRVLFSGEPTPAIAGALMPLLPGLAMTTAVQDILRGDMVSGASHLLEAALTAALIACGSLAASGLFALTGGAAL